MQAIGFAIHPPVSCTIISRFRGSEFGITDQQAKRIMELILKQVSCGTELSIVQAGIPAVIPTEACYLGWQESLAFLASLVEPEIPD
ncbi:SRPBCC domain-containing protein [uncultured Gimesia sp.]|uniref:SRPBCC domain-containing protein n=1 Tax=uncultured Gimesia sp. TaxID=1678688 RepID=UPI0030D9EDAB|tara:strand:+ start:107553 stop:107813 length:261 start_codon:yes stop_codon:yes gene_type:complete